jgi:ATP-dependent Lon protease
MWPTLTKWGVALGDVANPFILLDEIDRSVVGGDPQGLYPLARLHGALERETAQRIRDVSVDIEFDASLATYIVTANSLRGIGAPIVSRMEVSVIEPPSKGEGVDIARSIAHGTLRRLKLEGQVQFERGALVVLAHLSPRGMTRAVERAVAAAGRSRIGEAEFWTEVPGGRDLQLHCRGRPRLPEPSST